MNGTSVVAAMWMLLLAVPLPAQGPAPQPDPEHKRLEIYVGDWTTETEVKSISFTPALKAIGNFSARPILGGFFIEFRGESKGPAGIYQWLEIDSYDPTSKRYTAYQFDTNGHPSVDTFTMDNKTFHYSGSMIGGGKEYKRRTTVVFGSDFASYTEKCEISEDGKTWITFYEGKGSKVKSAPK